jgi:hypothetical protein
VAGTIRRDDSEVSVCPKVRCRTGPQCARPPLSAVESRRPCGSAPNRGLRAGPGRGYPSDDSTHSASGSTEAVSHVANWTGIGPRHPHRCGAATRGSGVLWRKPSRRAGLRLSVNRRRWRCAQSAAATEITVVPPNRSGATRPVPIASRQADVAVQEKPIRSVQKTERNRPVTRPANPRTEPEIHAAGGQGTRPLSSTQIPAALASLRDEWNVTSSRRTPRVSRRILHAWQVVRRNSARDVRFS